MSRGSGNSTVTVTGDGSAMQQTTDRTGILILRLWIEGNAQEGFRARITQTLDATGPERAISTAGDPKAVYAVVQAWVEAFVNTN
jgi:hypothetical protein